LAKYSYIVAACSKYTPELCALLNSLDYVGNTYDVHLIWVPRNDDKEFINQLEKLSYKVILHEISPQEVEASRGVSEVTCRKRYWYAAEVGKDYDAICVLDADLIFCRNPWHYFEIAKATGFVLGVSKEQNKVYDHEHHEVNGQWIWSVPRGTYNDKDLCNCPLFVNPAIWGDALRMSWDVFINGGFRAPDMDAMNLALLQYGSRGETIVLPGIQWLGTNEQMLKPYIRVVERHNNLWTECGIEIMTYHGQYYKDPWRACQLANRHQCAAGYLKATENSDQMAAGAMDVLYRYFLKMLDWKINITKKNYVEI
jgi:hypothetical protein